MIIKMTAEEKELIVYALPVGKRIYDDVDRIRSKVFHLGTDILPFKAKLDIRGGGKRFIVDLAMQCLEYLLDKDS